MECSADYESGSVFTEREEKLIRLGLDPAAAPGEVANSGATYSRACENVLCAPTL
jgi:hypothetical protein